MDLSEGRGRWSSQDGKLVGQLMDVIVLTYNKEEGQLRHCDERQDTIFLQNRYYYTIQINSCIESRNHRQDTGRKPYPTNY